MEKHAALFRAGIVALAAALALALFVAPARAGGGDYEFDGGSRSARTQVRGALEASSFPWDVVPAPVTIHIRRGITPHATPGDIWLDARLLGAGRFAWGIVQHEYAHQVAFFLVGERRRARLTRLFDSRAWCHERADVPHHLNACERFADLLAWAHWPSPHNVARYDAARRPAAARRTVRWALRLAR